MARIRTIKPEFWSSPDTAACDDPWARLLFIAMWNWADDEGRGTANPKELGGFAFPNDEKIDSADIRRMLGGIRRAFGVILYMVDGRPYYAIPSWKRHQKIDKRSGGKYPAPEEGQEWDPDPGQGSDQDKRETPAEPAESSAEPAESAPTPRRILGAGTGEQGNRGTGEKDKEPTAQNRGGGETIKLAQEITKAYTDLVPLSRFPAILGIVRKALAGKYEPEVIKGALLRLAAEGRSVTLETLRIEVEGRPPTPLRRPGPGRDADGVMRDPKTKVAIER